MNIFVVLTQDEIVVLEISAKKMRSINSNKYGGDIAGWLIDNGYEEEIGDSIDFCPKQEFENEPRIRTIKIK